MKEIWKEFRLPILLGSASVISIAIALLILFVSARPDNPIEFSASLEASAQDGSPSAGFALTVDVAGAVARPGVYELGFGSRVEDAIRAAGGITSHADKEIIEKSINRAAKLSDGAKLYIPAKGKTTITELPPQSETSSTISHVSINTASASQLEELSGVGPVTAQKIISGRPYSSIEELVTKKAVGQSLFDKIRSSLTL